MGDGARRMFRYTVPVDDTPWTFDLTSDPVHVASGATLDEVDFWAEFTSAPRWPAGILRVDLLISPSGRYLTATVTATGTWQPFPSVARSPSSTRSITSAPARGY